MRDSSVNISLSSTPSAAEEKNATAVLEDRVNNRVKHFQLFRNRFNIVHVLLEKLFFGREIVGQLFRYEDIAVDLGPVVMTEWHFGEMFEREARFGEDVIQKTETIITNAIVCRIREVTEKIFTNNVLEICPQVLQR